MKRSAIKISVVIPCFNGGEYLTRCVNSVLNQSRDVNEIIIVDDCSTDNSEDIILQLLNFDSKIKTRFLKKNGGVSHARNEGIDCAVGDYITFVDADDILPTDAIERYMEAVNAYPGLNIYQGLQNPADRDAESDTKLLDALLLRKICLGYPRSRTEYPGLSGNLLDSVHGCYGKLYALSAVRSSNIRFRENIGLGEDLLFYYEMLQASETVCVLNAWVYKIIYEGGSATRSLNPKMPGFAIKFAEALMDIEKAYGLQTDVSYQINQHVNKAIGCYFGNIENKDNLIVRAKELRKFLSNECIHKAYGTLMKSRYSTGVRKLKYCLLRNRFSFTYMLIERILRKK